MGDQAYLKITHITGQYISHQSRRMVRVRAVPVSFLSFPRGRRYSRDSSWSSAAGTEQEPRQLSRSPPQSPRLRLMSATSGTTCHRGLCPAPYMVQSVHPGAGGKGDSPQAVVSCSGIPGVPARVGVFTEAVGTEAGSGVGAHAGCHVSSRWFVLHLGSCCFILTGLCHHLHCVSGFSLGRLSYWNRGPSQLWPCVPPAQHAACTS